MQIVVHVFVTTILLFAVGRLVSGVEVRNGKAAFFGAMGLGLANALVRPVLLALTFPITFLTLGLFVWVVNALMLMLVAAMVEGFEVDGFWPALWGSLWLAGLNFLVGVFFGL